MPPPPPFHITAKRTALLPATSQPRISQAHSRSIQLRSPSCPLPNHTWKRAASRLFLKNKTRKGEREEREMEGMREREREKEWGREGGRGRERERFHSTLWHLNPLAEVGDRPSPKVTWQARESLQSFAFFHLLSSCFPSVREIGMGKTINALNINLICCLRCSPEPCLHSVLYV